MSQQVNEAEPIYSSLGADPDLGEIVVMFVDEMADRRANLIAQMEAKNWEELRRAAHQLKGAAGSYGYDKISPSAAKLEAAVREAEPEQQIRAALDELLDLCSRIRAGAPS